MTSEIPSKPLQLYGNLIKSQSSSVISSEPVIYSKQERDDAAAKQDTGKKNNNAAANSLPLKQFPNYLKPSSVKPQANAKKTPQAVVQLNTSSPDKPVSTSSTSASASAPFKKTTIADWTTNKDDERFYGSAPKAYRGRNKRQKKNKQKDAVVLEQDWDAIYDLTNPTRFEAYKDSTEQTAELIEWTDRLYAHRTKSDLRESVESGFSSAFDVERNDAPHTSMSFAPPSSLSFAPPKSYDDPVTDSMGISPEPDAPSGEDAYSRRMRLSGINSDSAPSSDLDQSMPPSGLMQHTQWQAAMPAVSFNQHQAPSSDLQQAMQPRGFMQGSQPHRFDPAPGSSHPVPENVHAPSMQPPVFVQSTTEVFRSSPPRLTSEHFLPITHSSDRSSPPKNAASYHPSAVISAAPVRYSMPAAPVNLPANREELDVVMQNVEEEPFEEAEEAPRSNRPGQKDFAKRLLEKMGWKKGDGLGKEGTGITTALAVKVEKRKKKPDAQGGGYAGPSGMGKIVGGKRKKGVDDDGPGMSPVVVCRHMVDGMDLDVEMGPNGNLVEEIGMECASKYGNIERVFIDRHAAGSTVPVFLKFTEAISALRAVSALQGRVFAGNTVQAEFFDEEKFDKGIYQ